MGNQIPWFDLITFNMKVLITLALLFACALAKPLIQERTLKLPKIKRRK